MQFIVAKRVLNVSRLLVLLGLLAGLLFSYGEGIRLLPFGGSGVSSNSQITSNQHIYVEYQKNILRISKTRKEENNGFHSLDPHDLQAVLADHGRFVCSFSLAIVETSNEFSHEVVGIAQFMRSVNGRAPPVS